MPKAKMSTAGKRLKRTYGTGSVRQVGRDTWELGYRPEKSRKRLTKRIRAPNRKAAEEELIAWRRKLDRQPQPGCPVLLSELFELHLDDMRRQQRDAYNIRTETNRIRKNLAPVFALLVASSITPTDIAHYINDRINAGALPSTINRELSALRRALNLGVEHGLLSDSLPKIKCLPERNARKGFVEHDTYLRVLRALPSDHQMLWCFGYYLGVRKGELLQLRWEWLLPYLGQAEPIIKIPGECTKSGDPHTIPLYHEDLRHVVEMALKERDPKCPYLFQHEGEQLKFSQSAWTTARNAAGKSELIFHDTRRTAIRLMEQVGIPRAEAMQITGHKTEAIYKRYDIASERGAIRAGEQLREYFRRQSESNEAKIGGELAVPK